MKHLDIDTDRLRCSKQSSAESQLEWLYSALVFGKAKKKVTKARKSRGLTK